jgi:predicted nucleic acid-binding protein
MRFLLDTNCWMQIAREREHASTVQRLLSESRAGDCALTDFSLHSLGLVMHRHGVLQQYPLVVAQVGPGRAVSLLRLAPRQLQELPAVVLNLGLDFDDAYQYHAADLHDLALVSLDADFDHTPRGRLTPDEALQLLRQGYSRNEGPETT